MTQASFREVGALIGQMPYARLTATSFHDSGRLPVSGYSPTVR